MHILSSEEGMWVKMAQSNHDRFILKCWAWQYFLSLVFFIKIVGMHLHQSCCLFRIHTLHEKCQIVDFVNLKFPFPSVDTI